MSQWDEVLPPLMIVLAAMFIVVMVVLP